MGPGGLQFNFTEIRDPGNVGYTRFYTSNISLKKPFLLQEPHIFDTDFIHAACEDIELGYRLSKRGMRIIYNRAALGYHNHMIDLDGFLQREEKVGQMLVVLGSKHPEIADSEERIQELLTTDLTEYHQQRENYLRRLKQLENASLPILHGVRADGKDMHEQFISEILNPLYRHIAEQARTSGYVSALQNGTAAYGGEEQGLVSIVIPVFNEVTYTRQCLENLAANTGYEPYEVIIVDNGSSDTTEELLSTLQGDVTIIRNDSNRGFAVACNQGAEAARGEYVVFLNNDTIPQRRWLMSLVHTVRELPQVAIVGSKLLYPDGSIQHAGVAFDLREGAIFISHIYKGINSDHPAVNYLREYNAVTAASMLVRRSVFMKLGMFDEGFVNGYEDVDFCLRVRQQGHSIYYNPESVLYHYEEQTEGRLSYGEINTKHFLEKWHGRIEADLHEKVKEDGFCIIYDQENKSMSYASISEGAEASKEMSNPSHGDDTDAARRRVAIVRGANLNKWEMQNYESLANHYDITAYATEAHAFDISNISLPVVQLPSQQQGLLLKIDGLEQHLCDKDLIHCRHYL
jgi:GT2 family glycosyltransferase